MSAFLFFGGSCSGDVVVVEGFAGCKVASGMCGQEPLYGSRLCHFTFER